MSPTSQHSSQQRSKFCLNTRMTLSKTIPSAPLAPAGKHRGKKIRLNGRITKNQYSSPPGNKNPRGIQVKLWLLAIMSGQINNIKEKKINRTKPPNPMSQQNDQEMPAANTQRSESNVAPEQIELQALNQAIQHNATEPSDNNQHASPNAIFPEAYTHNSRNRNNQNS